MGAISRILRRVRFWLLGFLPWAEEPGLRAYGQVDPSSPVLLTGNSGLTLLALEPVLARLEAYLVVVDTQGRDLLSAVAGGMMTSQQVIAALAMVELQEKVAGRRVVLSRALQGVVDPAVVERDTGWQVVWGPADHRLLGQFLQGDEAVVQEPLGFPLGERLRLAVSLALPLAVLLALPGLLAGPTAAAIVLGASWVLFLLTGMLQPILGWPGWQQRIMYALGLGLLAGAAHFFLIRGELLPAACWAGAIALLGGWIAVVYPPRKTTV